MKICLLMNQATGPSGTVYSLHRLCRGRLYILQGFVEGDFSCCTSIGIVEIEAKPHNEDKAMPQWCFGYAVVLPSGSFILIQTKELCHMFIPTKDFLKFSYEFFSGSVFSMYTSNFDKTP